MEEVEQSASVSHGVRIKFPKPLPPLQTESLPDDTGFTAAEKVALRNAWRVIKRLFRHHAFEIYLDFFSENDIMLERFRNQQGHFKLGSLNRHPMSVLKVFERLIDEGLDNAVLLHVILTEVAVRHELVHVPRSEILIYTDTVRNYLITVLRNISSPTLLEAVTKLCDLITSKMV